jgi:hypothetical protein
MEIGRSHGDLAIRDKQISSTERTAGANIGVQMAKDNNGSVGPASPPPTRPPK